MYEFKEGLACVGKNGKYGFIDRNGKTVIPLNYDRPYHNHPYSGFSSGSFNQGLTLVNKNNSFGIINSKGDVVLDIEYKKFTPIQSKFSATNYIKFSNTHYTGIINTKGKIIIPVKYNSVEFISEHLILAKESQDTHWASHHIYRLEGKKLLSRCYYKYPFGKDGLAGITDDGKTGYINKQGKIVIPIQYRSGGPFKQGLARVEKRKGKHGYIDVLGNIAIPFEYYYAYDFSDGKAMVKKKKGDFFYINSKGECVKNCE